MKCQPNAGMYSIKLTHRKHLENGPLFTPVNLADGLPHLMNFSNRPRTARVMQRIPPGHKALVYLTSPIKKFIWAIEYTGTRADGQQIATDYAHLMPPPAVMIPTPSVMWNVNLLPIKFLATIDPAEARDAQDVLEDAGVVFIPPQASMKRISQDEYDRIFDVIEWDWVSPAVSPVAAV